MKVVQLIISNYLGIKAVDITPDGNVIRIEGKNGAGKSSVIDSIWAAIGGKDDHPKHPIRNGETDARIFVDLGDISVERTFTEKGTYLTVKTKDGFKATSPQESLNKLFSRVSYDPTEFARLKPAQKREYLLDLTGQREALDALDKKRKQVFEERTNVNRDVKVTEGKLVGAPADEAVEEKSVAVLMANLNKAREYDAGVEDEKRELDELLVYIDETKERIAEIDGEIARLTDERTTLSKKLDSDCDYATHSRSVIKTRKPSDVPAIEAELGTVEEHNARVRKIKDARELRIELARHKAKSDNLTAQINKIDAEKDGILKASNIPIDNLVFADDDILVDGKPFDDLSTAEKIRISMRIGIASNPRLRVMRISQGSELDADSMAEVRKIADENDVQVWMECVANAPQEGIFIQDGEVLEPEPATVEA